MGKKRSCLFLCMEGLQSFIVPIVNELEREMKVKLVLAGRQGWESQLSDYMEYDTLWLEWANELAITMTMDPKAAEVLKGKRVIMRCHSYEVLSGLFQNVDLKKLDALIFVAKHVRDVGMQLSAIKDDMAISNRLKVWIIPNGVDTERFVYEHREKGNDIAFVGHINHKKGFQFLLHAFADLPKEMVLHVAGEFQDYRFKFYADHILEKMKIRHRVKFYGKVDDIPSFLSDKHFIISSSPWEGHPVNIIEGMAMGLKPLVHDFPGALDMYPAPWVWSDVVDLVDIIDGPYNPEVYAEHVKKSGWTLDAQMNSIMELFDSLEPLEKEAEIQEINIDADISDIDTRSKRAEIGDLSDMAPHIVRACGWISNNLVGKDGFEAIAVSSAVRNDSAYPEVTGYLIPTLLSLGKGHLVRLAENFSRALISIYQNEDGGFPGPGGVDSIVFDTAQVLRGLFAMYHARTNFDRDVLMKSISKAVGFLEGELTENGFKVRSLESYKMPGNRMTPQAVNLYSIVPFLKASELTGQWSPKIEEKARNTVISYVQQGISFKDRNMLSHFFFYCLDGMLEIAENYLWASNLKSTAEAAIMDEELFLPRKPMSIPALRDVKWICSPGQAQAALVFRKLGMMERFHLTLDTMKMLQNRSGGFYGSYGMASMFAVDPAWYFPISEIPWAVKFFIDACVLEMIDEINMEKVIDGQSG